MEIKITTLSENTAKYGFLAEWGLSILVEVDGLKILVDTGLSFSAVHNAQLMGIDLSTIDIIMISHGHTDHTGGLRDVLKLKGKVEVFAHPDIWAAKYVRRNNEEAIKYIGIPFSREELESYGAKFNLTIEPLHITKHIMTTGEIPLVTDYEKIEDNLMVKCGANWVQDKLADDLALFIDTYRGLVIILGCAHRGIINTVHRAQSITGKKQVYAIIGGTHLFKASKQRIGKTITELKEMGIQKLGVSHCTGFYASSQFARELDDVFFLNNAGSQLNLL